MICYALATLIMAFVADMRLSYSWTKKFVSMAIMTRNRIPYLTPELVLLYKSSDTEREGYQLDYDSAIEKMITEQKNWLQEALKTMNPSGHKWLEER